MKNAELHPMIAAALQGLDLNLETELTRFRQSKAGFGQGLKAVAPVFSLPASPAVSWQGTNEVEPKGAPANSEMSVGEDWPDPDAIVTDPAASTPLQRSKPTLPTSQLPDPDVFHLPPLDLAAILEGGTIAAPEVSTHRLLSGHPTLGAGSQPGGSPSEPSLSMQQPYPWSADTWSGEQMPQDYLASTEVLLNSLTDDSPALTRQTRPTSSHSFPLILSLGLTSLTLGGGITAMFFLSRPNPQPIPQQPTPAAAVAPSSLNAASSAVPTAANLAQVEFQNLSQTSLSVLPPGTQSPLSTTKAGMVRVVIHNGDAKLLGPLQKLVPGAFMEPTAQGTKIQLGLYSDVRKAEALIASLREQGYAAELERP